MSDYDRRPAEMLREVALLQERASEEERRGGPPASLGTYVRLQAGIAAYAEWRARALDDGLAWLTPDSSATARSQQERWANGFGQRGGEAFKMLTDLVSRDDDPIEQTFEFMAMQESIAFTAITRMPLAGFVGQVREYLRDFEKYHTELNSTWKEIVGQDERLDGQIAGLRVQVLEMFKKAASDARGWAPKIESAIGTVLLGWEKKEEPSPDPSIAPVVKTAFDTVYLLQTTLDQITRSALALYSQEQTIHGIFGKVREQLDVYLTKVNKATVLEAWSEARAKTKDAAASCPKDGQKADLLVLVENAIRESEEIVEEFNDAFDDFYEEFEGRFTGEVSDETVEMLAEHEFFNGFWRDVESLNLPGELRTAADQIARCEDISLDRLTDEQRGRFKELIRDRISELEKKIREMDSSFLERFELQFITIPRKLIVDKIKDFVGYEE
ncbi:MAG TPA: hypothetical protein VNO75_12015 [Gemmatimonadaceae bacterium]|nr:hypothetical protein [Gemmatimonadaceae bacterium]